MSDAVRSRIEGAGGKLVVWAVLHEDVYETRYGDGFYRTSTASLSTARTRALAELAGDSEWVKWHVKDHQLGLENGEPAFLRSWPKEEEFTINDFVEILADILLGKAASKLCTGVRLYKHGPFVSLPEE